MDHARVTLFAGHYGSGKTNIAVNYALALRREVQRVTIADLDTVNPYFRTKDSERELQAAGVSLICSDYANTTWTCRPCPSRYMRFSTIRRRMSWSISAATTEVLTLWAVSPGASCRSTIMRCSWSSTPTAR